MATVNIGSETVDLAPDELPEFTYSLNELSDPAKVRGARSTTFDVPATNAARAALGGITTAEEAKMGIPIRIGDGGLSLFQGTCTPVEWGDASITINAYGDNASWFQAAKATKLSEIDLGRSPIIDEAHQRASWTDEEQADVYPLIDYGRLVDRASTYNVPMAWLRPGLRVHKLLAKFFADNGFSVRAVQGFAAHWKKLILPNNGPIYVSTDTLSQSKASVFGSGTFSPLPNYPNAVQVPPSITSVDDPNTVLNGSNQYVAPFNMRVKVRISGTFTTGPQTGGILEDSQYRIGVVNVGTAQQYGSVLLTHTTYLNTSGIVVLDDRVITEFDAIAGQVYTVGLYEHRSGSTAAVSCSDVAIVWDPVNIEYQEGVSIDIAAGAPKMTVAELIQGLTTALNLTIRTDSGTGIVTLSYYDDYLRSPNDGIVWADRVDHRTLSKVQPVVPSAYSFQWKEEKDDLYLKNFREANDRGFGDYLFANPTGTDGDTKIDVPFAATYQDLRLENLMLPCLRKDGPYYQQDFFEWTARLLVLDGTAFGEWVHDGDALDYYPRTYFVGTQSNDISLAFGNEPLYGEGVKGSVFTRWSEWIRRAAAPYLKAKCRVYDDEFMGFSFDRPRLVHDGWNAAWYYVSAVKGKRFGDESLTECELIPV